MNGLQLEKPAGEAPPMPILVYRFGEGQRDGAIRDPAVSDEQPS